MAIIYTAAQLEPIDTNAFEGNTLLVTLPGAFSDVCTEQCVPGIMESIDDLRDAGITQIVFVTSDPHFAILEWIEQNGWDEEDVLFATDFGEFNLRQELGAIGDEDPAAPVPIAHLLRRTYTLYKNGEEIWQYTEADAGKYSLNIDDLSGAL